MTDGTTKLNIQFDKESYAKQSTNTLRSLASESRTPEKIYHAFGNEGFFKKTLSYIHDIDKKHGPFSEQDSIFYQELQHDYDVAERFTGICIRNWQKGNRPSLPAIVTQLAYRAGCDELDNDEIAVMKAMLLISARAEMIKGAPPETSTRSQKENPYHNTVHTANVTTIVGFLVEKNKELSNLGHSPALTRKDHMLLLLTALAHDIDHNGGKNKAGKYDMEDHAFNVILPIMEAVDMKQDDIERVHLMIRATSPDGPHGHLTKIAAAYRESKSPDLSVIDPDNKFPELRRFLTDEKLTEMAAILTDADLYASSGAGFEANKLMSEALTKELQNNGIDVDFTTSSARNFFLTNVLGKGYSSHAANTSFGTRLDQLRNYPDTQP